MEEAVRDLLEAADRSFARCPPEFNLQAAIKRVAALKPELDRIVGSTFELDQFVEDATFFADLRIRRHVEEVVLGFIHPKRYSYYVIAVRFSSYGSLFTVWGSPDDPEYPPEEVQATLVQAVSEAGFVYVPYDDLHSPYTGIDTSSAFPPKTWWDRFFDYI